MNTHFFPFGQMISMYRVGHGWLFERLIGKLSSNRHTVLLAEEGWGEMEFVSELGFQLREKFPDIHCCYIDCRQVYSRDSFLELFARSLRNRFQEVSIREDLDLMSMDAFEIPLIIAKRKKIRLAIFITSCHLLQRIPERVPLLRTLRKALLKQKNCTCCFFGKKTPEMIQLVQPPGPLFRFGQYYVIGEKQLVDPSTTIRKVFHDQQKEIDHALSVHIRQSVDNHPFYVTLLTWQTLIRTGRVCTREDVQSALKDILLHYDHQFNLIVERLTDRQLNLLKAIVEGNQMLFSENIREKYQQGSSGSVSRTISCLKGKELIEQRYREYVIVDPIFKVWLRQQYQDQGPTAS